LQTDLANHFLLEKTCLADGLYNGPGIASHNPILSTLDPDHFPEIRESESYPISFELDKEFMLKDFKWMSLAMSKEPARYYLNGIYLAPNGDMVATDGHRLNMISTKHRVNFNDRGVIVPRESIEVLFKIIAEHKKTLESVLVEVSESHTRFTLKGSGSVLIVRNIDGTFPDYLRVIPNRSERKNTDFNLDDVKTIDKRLKEIGAKPRDRLVKLNGDGATLITSINDEPYTEKINVNLSLDIEIGFNVNYLKDTINGVLYYKDSGSAVRIDNQNKTAVVMPVRV
jgi:DNA polymerase-3 subunit beta